jgi:hypothetical protein
MKVSTRSFAMLMLVMAGSQLTACAPAPGTGSTRMVEQAYNSTGVVSVKPYTRTIFSTIDF